MMVSIAVGRRPGTVRHVVAACLALGALLVLAASASADQVLCATGSGAGQCKSPSGVAFDPANDRVYLADAGNNRVDVFELEASGAPKFVMAFGWGVLNGAGELQSCSSSCEAGKPGPGAGQMSAPEHLAVDDSSGAIYLSEEQNHRVQKFDSGGGFEWTAGGEVNQSTHANLCTKLEAASCGAGVVSGASGEEGRFLGNLGLGMPVAVGSGGELYVADSKKLGASESEGFSTRVQRFDASGTYLGPQLFLSGPAGRVADIAMDGDGDVYASTNGGPGEGPGVGKYHAGGAAYGAPYPIHPNALAGALAVDPTGDLFMTNFKSSVGTVLEYDPSGAQSRTIYGTGPLTDNGQGVSPYQTADSEGVIVSQSASVLEVPFPAPGPQRLPGSCSVGEITSSKATFKCEVNPEGKASEYLFQYVDEAGFQAHGFEDAESSTPQELAGGIADFSLHLAETKLPAESLLPETEYHARIIATNAAATPPGNPGEELLFTTKSGPEALESWATEVGSDSALAHAEVNPNGIEASGRFEYVDDATYRHNLEEFGPGHGFENARLSATIDFGKGEAVVAGAAVLSGLQAGTTYHYRLRGEFEIASTAKSFLGPEQALRTFGLPEAETGCSNQQFRTGPAAALPDCRGYEMVSPLEKNNGDIITRINATGYPTALDQSSEEGSGFTYSSYRAFANPQSAPYTDQYLAHRRERGEAGEGWSSAPIDPPRSGLFRSGEFENEYKAFSADLASSWLLQEGEPPLSACAPAGFADLYRRESAGGAYQALSCAAPPNLDSVNFWPELEGFSANGAAAVFRVNDELALSGGPAASTAGNYQVYESSGAGQLRLVSVLPDGEASSANSSAGTALTDTIANHNREQSVLGAVSANGQRVFWSAGTGAGTLYLRNNALGEQSADGGCDEAGRACTVAISPGSAAFFQAADPRGDRALFSEAGSLYEAEVSEEENGEVQVQTHKLAEGVQGSILGASEDLSRVYFASTEALAGGGVAGQANIYLAEAGTTRFIGTLWSGDLTDNQYGSPISTTPILRTARVSANGASLVFMSSSKALSEAVAGYDNTDAVSGQPDAEVYLYDAEAEGGEGKLRCVSCNPSGERPRGREIEKGPNGQVGPWGAAIVPRFESELYQPRYLSADGKRVFFDSFDALALGDTNGAEDVYEWEAPGTGSCRAESSSYVAGSEGCLRLISSGKSPDDSEFLDASPSGSDAFFTTVESLVPQDYGLIDVYDARENGGFPAPAGQPAACEGEACQSPPEAPNDPTPSSSAYEGPGNLVEGPAKKKKQKHKQAKQKKHKQKHKKHKHKKAKKAKANGKRGGGR